MERIRNFIFKSRYSPLVAVLVFMFGMMIVGNANQSPGVPMMSGCGGGGNHHSPVSPSSGDVYPTSITLNYISATLSIGNQLQLVPTILPTNSTWKSVTYSSDNQAAATVDSAGLVKAVSAGTAKITAKTVNDLTAICTITVKADAIPDGNPTSVTFDVVSKDIKVGETYQLRWTLHPDTTTVKTVTFKSSNESVATVDANGLIKAVAYGSATITITTANGKTATFALTVSPIPVPVPPTIGSTLKWIKFIGNGTSVPSGMLVVEDDGRDQYTHYDETELVATTFATGKMYYYFDGTKAQYKGVNPWNLQPPTYDPTAHAFGMVTVNLAEWEMPANDANWRYYIMMRADPNFPGEAHGDTPFDPAITAGMTFTPGSMFQFYRVPNAIPESIFIQSTKNWVQHTYQLGDDITDTLYAKVTPGSFAPDLYGAGHAAPTIGETYWIINTDDYHTLAVFSALDLMRLIPPGIAAVMHDAITLELFVCWGWLPSSMPGYCEYEIDGAPYTGTTITGGAQHIIKFTTTTNFRQ